MTASPSKLTLRQRFGWLLIDLADFIQTHLKAKGWALVTTGLEPNAKVEAVAHYLRAKGIPVLTEAEFEEQTGRKIGEGETVVSMPAPSAGMLN